VARDNFARIRGEARPLDELLVTLARAHGLVETLRAHRLVIEWHGLVGDRIARVTAPDGLHRGVLSVWVKTSPWMQELRIMKEQVIREINQKLGDPPLVTDLRLHFGSAKLIDPDDPVAQLRQRMRARARPAPLPATPAPPSRAAQIAGESAVVEDEELRALIEHVRTRWDR
jgi:predicted nucleic acid-binding Zn ribbon protein